MEKLKTPLKYLRKQREYRLNNRERILEYWKEYNSRPERKQKQKEYAKKQSWENLNEKQRQKVIDRSITWSKRNPDKFQFNQCKSRAKANGVPLILIFKI